MAAPSPTGSGSTAPSTPQGPIFIDAPKQNLRGLNKPRCIQCGNVARSRCPFYSCKSCCYKAQNPCHIHVLKQSSALPEKTTLPAAAAPVEQPPPEAPSTGASGRLSSLRQLSTNFITSLRAKKPLSRKDAVTINKWRFSKLKEHISGEIEGENDAFERYLRNVSLLEETLSLDEGLKIDDRPGADAAALVDMATPESVSQVKVKLNSTGQKTHNSRERIRCLVDQKLRKLREVEIVDVEGSPYKAELDDGKDLKRPKKMKDWRPERTMAVADLVDKMKKARSEDDLKSCLEMKVELFKQPDNEALDKSSELTDVGLLVPKEESSTTIPCSYSLPKICTMFPITQDTLADITVSFSTLDQIAEL